MAFMNLMPQLDFMNTFYKVLLHIIAYAECYVYSIMNCLMLLVYKASFCSVCGLKLQIISYRMNQIDGRESNARNVLGPDLGS